MLSHYTIANCITRALGHACTMTNEQASACTTVRELWEAQHRAHDARCAWDTWTGPRIDAWALSTAWHGHVDDDGAVVATPRDTLSHATASGRLRVVVTDDHLTLTISAGAPGPDGTRAGIDALVLRYRQHARRDRGIVTDRAGWSLVSIHEDLLVDREDRLALLDLIDEQIARLDGVSSWWNTHDGRPEWHELLRLLDRVHELMGAEVPA